MTTTHTEVEKLVVNAARGCGLWIGLFADRSPQHELLKHELELLVRPVSCEMVAGAHVTLAHLGKSNGRREVEAAVTACHVLSEIVRTTVVSVEALARFWSCIVGIVYPRWIDDVTDKVTKCLGDHHVFPDTKYAGIRHVTMLQIKDRAAMSTQVPVMKRYDLRFSSMSVVCGDDRMDFALLSQSAEAF